MGPNVNAFENDLEGFVNGRDFSTRPSDSLEMTDESKGSAHCKGPLDHLLIVRYACFVPGP